MSRWPIAVLILFAVFVGYAAIQRANPTVLRTSIEIEATPQQVWAVLTDLDSYTEWNPFIVESSGDVKVGSTMRNTMHDATGDRVFTPEVLVADPGRELRGIGRLWGWGFFDGEHSFVIEEIAPGGCGCLRARCSAASWSRCWPAACTRTPSPSSQP